MSTTDRYPNQIKYIVGNEACERFSYYGMRSILFIFMTQYLMMGESGATSIYHLFIAGCYLLPLLGGFLSDRYLGKYRTILWLSIVYCIGHLVLAIWESQTGLYWGLALIALGAGGIKPCVSAHVGDQFHEKNSHLMKKVFSLFYWSINFGAFFSSLLIPWILPKFGPGWAFGIPGILMAIATWVFWLGNKHFVHVPPTGKNGPAGFARIFTYCFKHRKQRRSYQSFFDVGLKKFTKEEVESCKSAFNIFKVFIAVAMFWALFDQQGSTWVNQARQMDLVVWGIELKPSQIQAINPILVLLLIPVFTYLIYPAVEKMGVKLTPLKKMSAGMVLTGFSFVVVGALQSAIDLGQTVSVAWQFVPYLIITSAEVMVSITGLEFAYTQAPRSMKSTIMSFWFLTVFAGNLLTAGVAQLNPFAGAMEFYFYAGMMFFVSMIFIFAASRYKVRSFIEKQGEFSSIQPQGI